MAAPPAGAHGMTRGHGLRRLAALCALTALAPAAEAVLLVVNHMRSALPLAPQIDAPAPFGAFHDLRWLLVYHRSWTSFAVEAVALLAVRSTLTAGTVALAWPAGVRRPPLRVLLRRAAGFTVVTLLLLLPFATLLFGMAVVSVSYFFFAALPAVLVVALLVPHGHTHSWWRHRPPLRAVGWAAATFVVMSAAGAVATAVPAWAAVAVCALAGVFDALAWRGVVASVSGPPRRRFAPVAPAGLAAALAGTVLVTTLSVDLAHSAHVVRQVTVPVAHRAGRPVLAISGFGRGWTGGTRLQLGAGFDVRSFSYRGLDGHGQPLAYAAADTHRPLGVLVRLLAEQVRALQRATGQPVDVVAESEGALVTQQLLLTPRHPAVHAVVMLSPLVDPARVYFPPPGRQGWGVFAGWALRVLGASIADLTPVQLSPDGRLVRSIVDAAPRVRTLLSCRVPGVPELAMFPLADAVGAPSTDDVAVPVTVWPAFHGRLIDDRAAGRAVAVFLATGQVPGLSARSFTEEVLRAVASPWQVPVLRLDLNPVWRAQPAPACNGRQLASDGS